MSKQSHTPGPWIVSETDTNHISVRPSTPQFPGPDSPQGWGICSFGQPWKVTIESKDWRESGATYDFDDRGRAVYEMNKANARLIALAPDLLALCIKSLDMANGLGYHGLEAELEAAIARAKGEA